MRSAIITGFEDYTIFENGKIVNNKTGKELKHGFRRGYQRVSLYANTKESSKSIHRLLALAFIPNPNNYPQINHKDGNKSNFALENLEWCTASQNKFHAWETGLIEYTENKHRQILSVSRKRRKLILNHATGIFYEGVREASESTCHVTLFSLKNMLINHRRNKTSFKYV